MTTNEMDCKSQLKFLIDSINSNENNNLQIVEEDYINIVIEENIKIKNNISKTCYNNKEFELCNHKWKITIKKNCNDYKICLQSNMPKTIYIKFGIACNNNEFKIIMVSSLYCFNKASVSKICNGYEYLLTKEVFNRDIKPLIKNNKLIFGIYIQEYCFDNNIDNYLKSLKSLISTNIKLLAEEEYYEFPIEIPKKKNISFSPYFNINNHNWYIKLAIKNEKIYLSLIHCNSKKNLYPCNIDYVYIIRNCKNYDYLTSIKSVIFKNIKSTKLHEVQICNIDQLPSRNTLNNNYRAVVGIYIRVYDDKDGNKNRQNIKGKGNEDDLLLEYNTTTNKEEKEKKKIDNEFTKFKDEKNAFEIELKNLKKEKERIKKKLVELQKKMKNRKPSLVIANNNFIGNEYYHLDIKEDEFLIVTNWCIKDKEGWVEGYREKNKSEKGLFPRAIVSTLDDNLDYMYNEKSGITSEYKLSFKRKVSSIRSRLIPLLTVTDLLDPIDIKISRNNIYLDAYSNISRLSPNELKKKIQIEYNNEIGIDDSGLLKDFFYQLSKVVRKPDFGLFVPIQEDSYMLKINPDSKKKFQNNYLNHFKFIGRLIGLAIYHGHYLSIPFNILFYKELLNKNITIDDIKHIDASLYESLKSLKTCRNIDALDLTFEIDIKDSSGKNKTIELMKNGKSTKVNNNNINEYIDLLIKKKFLSSEEPLKKIKEGLYEIVPKTILVNNRLNENDLKFLINGINEIDINDWKNNTSYRGGYNNNSPTIKYFWQCVSEFNNKNRIKLLTFVTGNSQIPVTGFSDMINCCGVKGFHICKIDREDGLPVSHTCFNQIDLPIYKSYSSLKYNLLLVITEGCSSFLIR